MTKNRPDEWMPLYVGAYLRKTTHLTTEQHGAYLLLLMTYWVQQAPLPDDDMQLSAIAKVSQKRWKIAFRPVLEKLFQVGGGKWVQERAQSEINRAAEISETRSIVGKLGGQASAATRTKPQPNGQPNHEANAQPNGQQNTKQNATPSTLVPLNTERAALYDPRARLQKLCEVLRVSPATDANLLRTWPEELASLQAEGLEFERDILPAAEEAAARGTRVKSLKYLRGRAIELSEASKPPAVALDVICRPHEWLKRCQMFFDGLPRSTYPDERDDSKPKGTWAASWGPKPGEPGCLCPDEILTRFKHVEKT